MTKDRDAQRYDLLGRARAIVPGVMQRAQAAEQDRRISRQTHQEFVDSGLYRVIQPARYGGYELDFTTLTGIAFEIGRGCGSSAWVFTNLAEQNWINGMKDDRVQQEVWGDDPDTFIASSFQGPGSTAVRDDGGFRVDGTWSFSSGVDHVSWNNLQIFVPNDHGARDHYFALVPRSDFEIVDDWFPSGLAGTGSKSIVVKDVFIPDYRAIAAAQMVGGPTPGGALNTNPLYRLPMFSIGGHSFLGPAIGVALGALDAVEDELRGRSSAGGVKLAELATVHLRIAEVSVMIEAAQALIERDARQMMDAAASGRIPAMEDRARWRRNNAYVATQCVQAVEKLYPLTGGRGLTFASRFQRAWRDVHAATSQVALSWDMQATNYGRQRFGLDVTDPRAFPAAGGSPR